MEEEEDEKGEKVRESHQWLSAWDVSLLLVFCLTLCRSSLLLRHAAADAGLGVPSGFQFKITVLFLFHDSGKNM